MRQNLLIRPAVQFALRAKRERLDLTGRALAMVEALMLLLVKTGSLGGNMRLMTLCAPINLRVRALKRSRLAVLPLVILGKVGCCVRLVLLLVKTGSLAGKMRLMTLCAPINLRVRALKRSRLEVLPLVVLGKVGCCVRLVTIYKGTLEFFRYQRRFTDFGFFVLGLARATPVSFICPRCLFRIVGLGLLFLARLLCVGLQVVHCRHWRLVACVFAPRGSRFWW